MTMRPLLLDLCCGAGCASEGYVRAGFDVVGVDLKPQKRYRWQFIQADAVEFLREHGKQFDAVHASPPCQRWARSTRLHGKEHPDLITPIRDLLWQLGRPYVMENVEDAPLIDPIILCGAMFPGLRVYRHRGFETSFVATEPVHPRHVVPLASLGRRPFPDEFGHVVGHIGHVSEARAAMGVHWNLTAAELVEAVPPVYTEYVGLQLRADLTTRPAPERPFYRRDLVHG